ncbi:unnamed protein product, partial [Nesidiocoris tenuis]
MSLTLTSSSIVSMCSSSTLTSSLIVNLSLNSSLTLTSTLIVNPSLTSSLTSSSMVSMSLNSSLTLASRLIMSSSLTLTSSLVMSMSSISTFTSSLMSMSLTWILTLTSSSMPRDRYFCVKGASECAVVLAVLQPSGLHIGNPFNAGVFYMWGGGNWRSFLAKRGAEQMMLVKRSLGTADVEEASLYALNLPYFIVHLKRLGRKSMAWKTEKREKRRRGPVTIKSTWPIANRQRPEAKMQIRSSSTSRSTRYSSLGIGSVCVHIFFSRQCTDVFQSSAAGTKLIFIGSPAFPDHPRCFILGRINIHCSRRNKTKLCKTSLTWLKIRSCLHKRKLLSDFRIEITSIEQIDCPLRTLPG